MMDAAPFSIGNPVRPLVHTDTSGIFDMAIENEHSVVYGRQIC